LYALNEAAPRNAIPRSSQNAVGQKSEISRAFGAVRWEMIAYHGALNSIFFLTQRGEHL
jgi:hypothetical protein